MEYVQYSAQNELLECTEQGTVVGATVKDNRGGTSAMQDGSLVVPSVFQQLVMQDLLFMASWQRDVNHFMLSTELRGTYGDGFADEAAGFLGRCWQSIRQFTRLT